MNQKNRNLGNYDMVLSLSSNKINYQFHKMYQRRIIHSDWAFLTNSMGSNVKTLTNDEAKSYWEKIDTNKSDLEAKEAELASIGEDMTTAIEASDWDKVKTLNDKKETLKAEIETLQTQVDEAKQYDLGLIANIAEPKIDILSESSQELVFQISFKSGSTLFYTHEGKKAEYDLGGNGIQYAFRVSIGKVKITSDRKIVEIGEDGKETEKTLREKGINDNDFTIQSLFLDFENANISSYDSQRSKLPDAASANALLQAALVNYFKHLAKTDNPYILGYGIHKNEVQEGERALLYPTGVAYSTSYSNENRASTFNFLMLLDNHHFPTGGDAGVLPTSLMEYAQVTTATVNGVFGLNLSEFENSYIPFLSEVLGNKIKSKMGDKCKSVSFDNKQKVIEVGFGWHDVSGHIYLHYQQIQANKSNNGVDIVYKITSKATIHQEKKELIGTVGVDWDVSTSGRKKDSHGNEGSLIVNLKAGASGKLELEVDYADKFELGYDSDKPRYKDTWDEVWDITNQVLPLFSPFLLTIPQLLGKSLTGLQEINNLGDSLNIQHLENLENKIILPVSSVYTYKNVRLLDSDSPDNAALLFDTSYGTVTQ